MRLGRPARFWPYASGLALALLAAGAFLAWGPAGLGNGPLSAASIDGGQTLGTRPQARGLFIELDAGKSAVVIDRVTFLGGHGYRPPRVIAAWADRDEQCAGTFPWRGRDSVLRSCATGGLTKLLGKPVPAAAGGPQGAGTRSRGVTAAMEVGPPGAGRCWAVTSVVIHYHVGIRHYAATVPETFVACQTRQEMNVASRALGLRTS